MPSVSTKKRLPSWALLCIRWVLVSKPKVWQEVQNFDNSRFFNLNTRKCLEELFLITQIQTVLSSWKHIWPTCFGIGLFCLSDALTYAITCRTMSDWCWKHSTVFFLLRTLSHHLMKTCYFQSGLPSTQKHLLRGLVTLRLYSVLTSPNW